MNLYEENQPNIGIGKKLKDECRHWYNCISITLQRAKLPWQALPGLGEDTSAAAAVNTVDDAPEDGTLSRSGSVHSAA